jgi:hypothetical protein
VTSAEVELRFAGGRWRAQGAGIDFEHTDLRSLDALVVGAFAAAGQTGRVHMRFVLASLPQWLRQYHAHYCNYTLTIGRPRA